MFARLVNIIRSVSHKFFFGCGVCVGGGGIIFSCNTFSAYEIKIKNKKNILLWGGGCMLGVEGYPSVMCSPFS